MNLIQAIRIIKANKTLKDYSKDSHPTFWRLRTVRQISWRTFMDVDMQHPGVEYTYTPDAPTFDGSSDTQELPTLQVISSPVTPPAPPDAVEPETVQALGTKCGIRIARGFTHPAYRKIADIYSADGTRYYVLTHDYLGGKLYRQPKDVMMADENTKTEMKKAG